MDKIKYIYFEINLVTDSEKVVVEETIENTNALLFKPHTNSEGVWGFTNMTEQHHRSKKLYSIVNQHWVDLEKYNTSGSTYKKSTVDKVLQTLEEKMCEV